MRDAWPTGELPVSLSISQALASRGRLALRMGDPAAALADLEEAGRRAQALFYVNPCALMWRSYAALACARLGRHERARELVEEEVEIGRRFGAPEPLGEALRVRALLVPGGEMVEAGPRGGGRPRRLRPPAGACAGADRPRRGAPARRPSP